MKFKRKFKEVNILEVLIAFVFMLITAGLFALLMIEWAAGCGESYVDSKGQRHLYECVYLNNAKE
jgi:hypothetical protein